jgi:hypothetical protein
MRLPHELPPAVAQHRRRGGSVPLSRALLVLLASLVITLSVQVILADPAIAAPPEVGVEVVPRSVAFPSQGDAEALLVVRNPSADPLRNVQATSLTDAGVRIVPEETKPLTELAPEGEHTWTFLLEQTGTESIPGTVHFRVNYDWVTQGGNREVPQTAFGSLETKARAPANASDAAEVQVKSGIETLNQSSPGTLFLVIQNKSDVPVSVTNIVPKGPTANPPSTGLLGWLRSKLSRGGEAKSEQREYMVRFDCEATQRITEQCSVKGGAIPVAPYKSFVTAVNVTPKERVTPGKYVLLFEVPIQWGWPDATREGTLVATQSASIEVFGEAGILKVLGVPFLLALPGFLVVGTWDLLWRSYPWRPKDEMPAFPVTINTPQFWIVALSISGVVVYLYSLAFNVNYLQLYGFGDILLVWVISVGLFGVLLYLIYRRGQILYRRGRVPSEKDGPIQVLEKLGKRGMRLGLDRTEVKLNEKPTKLFLLEPRNEDEKKIWVGPYIVVEWPKINGEQLRAQEQLREQVRGLLKPDGDPGSLAQLLKQGKNARSLEVGWDKSKLPGRPLRIKTDDVKEGATEPDIIVVTN